MRSYFNYLSPFPFLPLKHSSYSSLISLKYMAFFINYYRTHISICMYICIPQYNLSSPYNVTCIYVFRADRLVLENELVCFSLGRATPFIHIFPRWPVVLCVGLRPLGFFLCGLAGSLMSFIFSSRLGSYVVLPCSFVYLNRI